ncbi:MAG: isopentenyl-diphosphate Delta-isomerase [Candidatus Aenigmarchaeota archaeon]|nr:isopentenyl-diphosphate Delta-isomerase [Candidatus Aenigmarchaeota archaeon]
MEYVILVNKNGETIGKEEKLKAHKKGLLHLAFSVFVFNDKNQLMLQKRSKRKYHSPNLWSNTCCSHPRPGEDLLEASHRRLKEEMGFICKLEKLFSFVYKEKVDDLFEHEYDYVLVGRFNGEPSPNEREVGEWKWMDWDKVKSDVKKHPEKYTVWFRLIVEKFSDRIDHWLFPL